MPDSSDDEGGAESESDSDMEVERAPAPATGQGERLTGMVTAAQVKAAGATKLNNAALAAASQGAKTVRRGKDGRIVRDERDGGKKAAVSSAHAAPTAPVHTARFEDDEELNAFQKAQGRVDDPLAMMGGGKRKRRLRMPSGKPYADKRWTNRFNLLPDYRWDGVDRSTGWEQALLSKR